MWRRILYCYSQPLVSLHRDYWPSLSIKNQLAKDLSASGPQVSETAMMGYDGLPQLENIYKYDLL